MMQLPKRVIGIEQRAGPIDASVVDQRIEPPKAAHRLFDDALPMSCLADVVLDKDAVNLLCNPLTVGADIGDDDVCASRANSAAAAAP